MKNITHYFMDSMKSCETKSTQYKVENKLKDELTRKRARVKIKISRTNSKNRICNVVENKNDLVDKTPSPFTKPSKEVGVEDSTPKKALLTLSMLENSSEATNDQNLDDISEISISKHKLTEQKMNGNKSIKQKSNDDIFQYSTKSNDKLETSNVNIKESSKDTFNIAKRHEESNVFQVLMSRNKPIEYSSTMESLCEGIVLNESIDNEVKEKLKKRKEKLIALANTKGYSKRKLAEVEEEEKIERIIEKRMKLFRATKDDSCSVSNNNQKEPSNNLLNLCSKAAMGEHQDMPNISTFVVKADVHIPEVSVEDSSHKKFKTISQVKARISNHTSYAEHSHTDNIDIITEDIEYQSNNNKNSQLLQQCNKPRCSLRIKLKSSKDEKDGALHDTNRVKEDVLFSPKSRTKFNELTKKTRKMSFNSSTNNNGIEAKNKHNNISIKSNKSMKLNLHKKGKSNQEEKPETNTVENDLVNYSIKVKEMIDLDEAETLKNCTKSELNDSIISKPEVLKIVDDKSKKKLAPLFLKQRKPDAATLEARRLFLQSGITDVNTNVKKNTMNCYPAILPFPKISHVTQLNGESKSAEIVYGNISMKPELKYVPAIDCKTYKYITRPMESLTKPLVTTDKYATEDIDNFLAEIEKNCKDAKKIWMTVLHIAKKHYDMTLSVKKKGRRKKSVVKETTLQENKENQIQSSMWIQKYKPVSAQKIIGNEEATSKLKNWLNGWRPSLTIQDDSINSADEFYSSDCSYISKIENNQVAVLLGPHGSGKTASVYAVAEEFGYKVLEVNASSRRTGKRILKEFEEATKSHRIEKEKINSLSTTVLKKSNKLIQNSLILLEDVDLIFDEDEGFVSAVCQLVLNTKRPIVMTCRDVCSHLSKMAPNQNRIYFQRVDNNKLSTLLELISMAETGSRLSQECLAELLLCGDLRKALLQLQYLLTSGFPQKSQHTLNLTSIPWQDMKHCLYKPAIKAIKKQKAKKNSNAKNTNDNNVTKMLDHLVNNLDRISLLPSLMEVNDPALNVTYIKPQSSLSLAENMTSYCASRNLSIQIAEWMDEKILSKEFLTGKDRLQYQANITLRRQLNEGVSLALAQVAPSILDSRTVSLDYLPYVRAICRAEEYREATNSKRRNRFFHYLHGLNLPISSTKPNILSAACRMLQEKMEKIKEDPDKC